MLSARIQSRIKNHKLIADLLASDSDNDGNDYDLSESILLHDFEASSEDDSDYGDRSNDRDSTLVSRKARRNRKSKMISKTKRNPNKGVRKQRSTKIVGRSRKTINSGKSVKKKRKSAKKATNIPIRIPTRKQDGLISDTLVNHTHENSLTISEFVMSSSSDESRD